MTTQIQEKQYTLEEYFDFEYASKVRHQFFDGKVVPMTYTSKSHGRIVNNLSRLLSNCLIDTAFEVYAGDRMLYIPACNQVYYPDLIILPEETETFEYKGKMEADLHPTVVMEVLSDSTKEHDRTDKWRCYQMIDSLQQYVLLSQNYAYVESFYRQDHSKKWLYIPAEGMDQSVEIAGCEVKLEDIYRRVKLSG